MRWRLIAPLWITALVALTGCDRPRPVPARPALFVVRDADTEIWLFGTIHVLPGNVRWETPVIDRAIAAADSLVTELPPAAANAAAGAFLHMSHAPGLPPISARIPAGDRAALSAAAARAGIALATLDQLKSWAAAVLLETGEARTDGASVENGVEARLARRFAGRPHLGLERIAEQLALFDGLPEPLQRRMLVQAVRDHHGFAATLGAWSRGDVAALDRQNDALFEGAPLLERTLLVDRNARWSRWIGGRMRQPGHVFVAVGAGHLAGPKSVVALLAARGYTVTRLQ